MQRYIQVKGCACVCVCVCACRVCMGVCVCACMPSHSSRVRLCATLWTIAHQSPQSMGFSRQEYRSGLPCPSLWDLSDPHLLCLLHLQVGSLPLAPPGSPSYIIIHMSSLHNLYIHQLYTYLTHIYTADTEGVSGFP